MKAVPQASLVHKVVQAPRGMQFALQLCRLRQIFRPGGTGKVDVLHLQIGALAHNQGVGQLDVCIQVPHY